MRLEVLTTPATDPAAARPPIVLVHGAWHGAWCWQPHVAPFLAAAGHDVHALSLRGHGGSEGRDRLNRHRLRHYVDDVAGLVADLAADRRTRPVVVGHSMGGAVVQRLLARPDRPRLAGAALLASVPPAGVLDVALRIARERPALFARANATLDLGLLVSTDELVRELFFSPDLPDAQVSAHRARMQSESYAAFVDMLALGRPRGRRVPEPVLVLGAADDRIFSVERAHQTARAWGTTAVVVDGLAHDVMLDTGWEAAAVVLRDWAAGLTPG